ncbi:hypothetical protein GCM10011490_14650 [Pseudoclavibacter endophyticus]|uniref:DUF4350 domain-containing protein n=1 Tax=Pseudoclavibacter endophyticus TaxID=1778590 RepID=A0A6H9WIS7_9MICO|nr:DUF4350 domain-containing protein [Pseudoclavibacter endophyticus]KAB1649143.1 DUF4350 domain-containing protein [Pseudoclavibacter endophyticus]GGA65072.1 hypothetical protein GCM10011490_14650 [Pseudoclavibacter endophyticus]
MSGVAPAPPAETARSTTARARTAAEEREVADSLTPTLGQRLRSGRLWIMIGVIAVLVTGVTALLQGMANSGSDAPLDPSSPRPNGAKAVVEVMGSHGVDVELASSLDDVASATESAGAANTTIVLRQRAVTLTQEQLAELLGLGAAKLVLITPGPPMLEALGTSIMPGGNLAGDGTQTVGAGAACDDPIATNAPEITQLGGSAYSVPESPGLSSCYLNDDRALVAIDASGTTEIVALGATANLTNEWAAYDGNAAMGIGIMGDTDQLIWYEPGSGDLATDGTLPPLSSLVPAWLTPAMVLLLATGIATMVWRGRRYGPLVAERLPVVVPASETMDGRARLYGRTGSRLRALDNLRIGTIGRLARSLALPATLPAHEVAVAVAQTVRRPRDEVFSILIEAVPANDGELVELSDHLLRLERACLDALAVPTTASRGATPPPPQPRQPHEGDA